MIIHNSIRVLIIGDYISGWGGNKVSGFKELAKAVESNGGFAAFAFPDAARNSAWINEIQSQIYFYSDVSLPSIVRLVNMAIDVWNVNIIHTHFWGPREIARLKVANLGRCKLIYHFRTFPIHKNDIIRKVFHHIVFYTGIKICISEGIKKAVECRYSKRNVYVVYNGLDLDRLANCGYADNNFNSSGKKILIMGYYFDRKGVDLALMACKRIEEQCNFQLFIISDDVEGCILSCKNILKSSKIPRWLTVLPSIEDVASYYRSMDIFLSPSRSEAFGMASIEAAYCGCRVIASKVPGQEEIGIPEIVWIANPEVNSEKTIEELTEALRSIILTEKIMKKNESIPNYIEQGFSMHKWVAEIINFYYSKG